MKATSFPIFFHEADVKVNLRHRTVLKKFLADIFRLEKKKLARIDYIFCSDNYLLELNVRHLNHNTYTDIITFDLSEGPQITAEVYISIERVAENANRFEQSRNRELLRVIFHGALHLCGYNDKTKKDQQLMRQKEDECLGQFANSVPRGTL